MKLISWNVNGIRAVLKKGFLEFLRDEDPDIIGVQETKATPDQVALDLPDYPYHYWNSAEKKGYSGTAIFSKVKPVDVTYGIGIEKHDSEGRVICMELEDCFLVNIYVPNAQRGLDRLGYRHTQWDPDLLAYLKGLEKTKPVIFCGDLNVAHREIDLANPKGNTGNAGFTPEERRGFDNIVAAGFIDTFRKFTPGGGHYTWWSYMGRAREKNIGWRIDYFCVSPQLNNRVKKSYILPHVMGSDHAPIVLDIDIKK
ncbi:MAG TPA: exodeoxyribonuclease III [Spirochaetota bacterium]|nr:exodeoxyribonuclease III [Spirochaetota bacterium]HPI88445.1 exodeoxyribonuclease III [Spirochaetota bacterium]HPR48808.1 exodeoxyribonuclease III [Spirochaetota bacterium]